MKKNEKDVAQINSTTQELDTDQQNDMIKFCVIINKKYDIIYLKSISEKFDKKKTIRLANESKYYNTS